MDNNQWIGWGVEITNGTEVARTQFVRAFPGSGVFPRAESEPVTYLDEAVPSDSFALPDFCDVRIATPAAYAGHSKLLHHCFGTVLEGGGAGPSYDHTFTIPRNDDAAIKGLSVEARYGFPDTNEESMLGLGVKIVDFGWNGSARDEIRFEANGVGLSAEQANDSAAPTFPDLSVVKMIPRQLSLSIDGNAYKVRSFSIRVNKGVISDDAALGQASILEPVRGERASVEAQFELTDWSKVLKGLFKARTKVDFVLTAAGPANHGGVWTIAQGLILGDPPEMNYGTRMPWTLNVRAHHDPTDTALKYVETNTNATI